MLQIKNLKIYFQYNSQKIYAVNSLDLSLPKGQITGLVGESGCGKSLTCLAILKLIRPPGFIEADQILFQNIDLSKLKESALRQIRGRQIAMIFQEPLAALNPVLNIQTQLTEALKIYEKISSREARKKSLDLLAVLGFTDPENCLKSYPHQLSGGMRQRVMIAAALLLQPKLLIADEPTTALDLSVQAQIISLLMDLQKNLQLSMLIVSHDLALISQIAQEIAVMYAGHIVEQAPAEELLKYPKHPYTQALINSLPEIPTNSSEKKKLKPIPGRVPAITDIPLHGCRFAPRCQYAAMEICSTQEFIPLTEISAAHSVRCLRINEIQ